jgi:hypothetical protein
VNLGEPFVPDSKAAHLMKPRDRSFDNPAHAAEALSRFDTSSRDPGNDSASPELAPTHGIVIALVGVDLRGAAARPANLSGHRGNSIDCGSHHLGIMRVRSRDARREGDSRRVDDDMVLGAAFAAVCGIRSRLKPPFGAGILDPSMAARSHSIRSARARSLSSSRCIRSQTPARCQALNRRQHVTPEPSPNSGGSMSHGIPDFRTKMIPVRTFRSSVHGRPPFL